MLLCKGPHYIQNGWQKDLTCNSCGWNNKADVALDIKMKTFLPLPLISFFLLNMNNEKKNTNFFSNILNSKNWVILLMKNVSQIGFYFVCFFDNIKERYIELLVIKIDFLLSNKSLRIIKSSLKIQSSKTVAFYLHFILLPEVIMLSPNKA